MVVSAAGMTVRFKEIIIIKLKIVNINTKQNVILNLSKLLINSFMKLEFVITN